MMQSVPDRSLNPYVLRRQDGQNRVRGDNTPSIHMYIQMYIHTYVHGMFRSREVPKLGVLECGLYSPCGLTINRNNQLSQKGEARRGVRARRGDYGVLRR